MCRMIGFSAAQPRRVGEFLDALAHQAQWGCRPWGRPHGDGWGMMLLTPSGWFHTRCDHPIWKSQLDRLADLEASCGLMHCRLASPDTPVNITKVHPFCAVVSGASVAFAHNGTIRNVSALPPPANADLPSDAIDTEFYFAHVRQRLGDGLADDEALRGTVAFLMGAGADVSSLNALMLRGDTLSAIKGPIDDEYRHYYTLYVHTRDDAVVVSTEPLAGWGKGELLNGTIVACQGQITAQKPLN
jgi:predicted glutamine amidotransferase